jgi:ribosomal protein L30E
VLAVFHQPGKPDWRLTYACKRSQLDEDTLEITSTQTAPRRYTFLLGENESCRTAAGRLAELREKGEHLTLEEVEKAFSVERLNKDFFKDYKKHYESFTAHLLAPESAKATRTAFGIATHKDKAEQDKADKPIRDFVKRLLGRLVFLHFLQKKGWMGCPAAKQKGKSGKLQWTGGDPDFLHTYYKTATDKNDAHRFHSRWLIPLFFDALNNAERPDDLFPPTGTRIPYLNGGLFETDPAPLHALDFPAEHFRALLDFFGQYHFTIDENDPEDHEVGIAPEMLGHIFENLLEDNKDKGAYYTPKAIVSYMARQSLLHYLQTHLGENLELAVLLNEKDTAQHTDKDSFVRQNAKRIADLLDAVKICDPAIGSGAFPIGLLQEILWTRLTLNWELNTPEERAKLKRRIIQNSIHGVDLDPGAVEIARLRFWLALVVDEDQPRPLPNLDYKIHRADSLIEYIRGEPVHLGKVSVSDKRTYQAIQNLIAAKAALFTAQKTPEKRAARFALYRSLAEVAMAEFTWLRNDMGLIAEDAERAAQLDQGRKEFGHRIKLIDSVAKQSSNNQDRVLAELRAWFDDDQKPTFLWQLHFGEVFAQGGFDIVIANPPYVRQESIKAIKPLLEPRFTSTFSSTADLFVVFYEQASNLLRKDGVLCYITSNKFYRAGYGKKLRDFLSKRHILHTLIDFGDAPVFNDVIAYASILIGQKGAPSSDHHCWALTWDLQKNSNHVAAEVESAFSLRQSSLAADGWRLVGHTTESLLAKLRSNGTPLGEYVQRRFYYGIKTGYNEAFVIDGKKRAELIAADPRSAEVIKPFLRGRDVKRWKATQQDLWLIFTRSGIDINSFPAIKAHLAQFRTKLEPKPANWPDSKQWEGRKGGSYHWYEIQDNIAYWQEFEQPKIIYPDIYEHQSFAIDQSGALGANTLYFIPTKERWLCSLLNSQVIEYFYAQTSNSVRGGYMRAFSEYIKHIPIPPASDADKARLSQLAEACTAAAQRGDDATLARLEEGIDRIVYRLFDLTPEEIDLIESALAPTRTAKPSPI